MWGVEDSKGQARRKEKAPRYPPPSRKAVKVPLWMAPAGLDHGPEARSRTLRAGGRILHSPI